MEVTDNTVTVAWDEVEGNDVYYQVRWKESASNGGWRANWTYLYWHHQIRKLTPGTQYTVQVRSYDQGGAGFGKWSSATMTTTGGETAPNQRAGVTVSAADPVTVAEGGSSTYTVVLDGQPTGNVVITPSSSNGDVTTHPSSLTFTPDNWQTAQTVTVRTAHDDDAADDSATVSHTVSGADEYAGIAVASVSVTVTDDDTAGVTVHPTSLSVNEGGSVSYTVVLDTRPVSNVLISAFASGVTAQPDELTFTPDNWQTAQTVTVSAPQDDDTEDETVFISHSSGAAPDSAYVGALVPYVTVSITDDDEAQAQAAQHEPEPEPEPGRITVSANSLPIREGGPAATYTVSLDVEPTVNVTITVSSDNGDVTAQPSSLTFTTGNWQTAQTVTVSVSEDGDETDDRATIGHSASGGNYDGVTVASVTVSVTDDDSDREVLRDFYHATGGASWSNNANWLSEKPLGEWHGVTTNGQGRVTAIVLDGNNLTGSLPAELGKLESLTRLALNRNGLSGAIPSQLGSLPNLGIIGLARNQLSGALPTSLGNLSGLTKVSLHDNTALSGGLPSGFGEMSGLTRLAVSRTGLSGPLPQGLVNNTVMQYLHFDDTSLCAPNNEAFQTWLDGVPDQNGPTCE